MIEIKVAAKETVKVTFGGNHGFDPFSFQFTEADLTSMYDQMRSMPSRLAQAVEHADGLAAECVSLREQLEAERRLRVSADSEVIESRRKIARLDVLKQGRQGGEVDRQQPQTSPAMPCACGGGHFCDSEVALIRQALERAALDAATNREMFKVAHAAYERWVGYYRDLETRLTKAPEVAR